MDRATLRIPLRHGLVAILVSEDTERSVYVPPPLARGEHHERCQCSACIAMRSVKGACQ
jgi:hypothetical protein